MRQIWCHAMPDQPPNVLSQRNKAIVYSSANAGVEGSFALLGGIIQQECFFILFYVCFISSESTECIGLCNKRARGEGH
jgi:hypothetical protein